MRIFETTNDANLELAILWQYERAEKLKALIGYQQAFFDEAVTAFWNTFRDEVFPLVSWKTVTVQYAPDTGFNGEYVYSSTLLKWVKGIYSICQDTDSLNWYMTDGTIIYFAIGNGTAYPPTRWERIA